MSNFQPPRRWLASGALLLGLAVAAPPALAQFYAGYLSARTASPKIYVNDLDYVVEDADLGQQFELPLNNPPAFSFNFNEPMRAFSFADQDNRFYVGLVTGMSLTPNRSLRGVDGYVIGVYDTKVYVKGSDVPGPSTFTVTASSLEIKAATSHQQAQMILLAYLCSPDQILLIEPSGFGQTCLEQARIDVKISGRNDIDFSDEVDAHTYMLNHARFEPQSLNAGSFEVVKRGSPTPIAEGARYDLPSRTGTFDLRPIITGESFYFHYVIVAQGTGLDEGGSRVFIGDPLDVNPGISMELGEGIEEAGTQPQSLPQQCALNMQAAAPDSRFALGADDTVYDLETNLVWPRCPQGYTLEGGNTPDLADDRCSEAETTTFSWQAALAESAAASARGDHGASGWRVPNAKELASLTETACSFPALNSRVFPLPRVLSGWTSTPGDFDFAFAVNFADGTLDTRRQTEEQAVWLVREGSGTPPLPDLLFANGFE